MPETKSHKAAKTRAAGRTGKTEVLGKKGRLDVQTRRKNIEIERSRDAVVLRRAIRKVAAESKGDGRTPEVRVPARNQKLALEVAKDMGAKVQVTNLLGRNATWP